MRVQEGIVVPSSEVIEVSMLKYETVASDLQKKISTGSYQANGQLPSVAVLCNEYGVSKITIKKAMDELESRGLISRRRGSGSFVKSSSGPASDPSRWEMSNQMMGFHAEHSALHEKISSIVEEFEVVRPPEKVAKSLGMDEDGFAYKICRVRLADDVPHAVEYTYMPIDVIPDLKRRHLETSIYDYIEGDLGLKITSAHRIVRAVSPTADEQAWLGVPATEPLLEIEQVGFLDDGVPFECSRSRHCNNYEFRSISTK